MPTVTLRISAASPTVHEVLFLEYAYGAGSGQWTLVQSSAWLPYTTTPATYSWRLRAPAGVTYLQAWTRDATGRLAALPYQAFINYTPPAERVAQGQGRIYRYKLAAGQSFTARVEPEQGNPDLAVWAPDEALAPWVSEQPTGVDSVSFVAPVPGVYQVEVRGTTDATYRLVVDPSAQPATISLAAAAGDTAATAAAPAMPLLETDSAPAIRRTLAAVGALYLPVIMR